MTSSIMRRLSGVHRSGSFVAAAIAAFALSPSIAGAVTASSTFDGGGDGWLLGGMHTCATLDEIPPFHQPTGGNPGGHIRGADLELAPGANDGCAWYARGPAKFRGDMRANYGGTVSYDVRHPAGADFGGAVQLSDTAGNTLVAGFPITPPPAQDVWTTYSFSLIETASNWSYWPADGQNPVPATRAHFFEVLPDVADLFLLGDLSFDSQGEPTDIDNVIVSEAQPPRDTDGDGTLNAVDDCPLVPGAPSNRGCPVSARPDGDGDGIPDAEDSCPSQAGPASNGGCPVPSDPPPAFPPADSSPPPSASDTDPPETTVQKAKVSGDDVKLHFTSDEPGSAFECRLDKGGFKVCTSPKRYRNLDDGKHRLEVRATDAAGNTDDSPAKKKVKIYG